MNKKTPYIPIILNILFPGLGYLFTGRKERRLLGIVLCVWSAYDIANYIIYLTTGWVNTSTIELYGLVPMNQSSMYPVVAICIAVDTYFFVNRINKSSATSNAQSAR